MKIIKKGKKKRLFRCKCCGCIFIADNKQYKETNIGITREIYKCSAKCPTCGAEVMKF